MTLTPVDRRTANVLIVDESDESREVLRTVLQGRGFRTIEAAEARQGLEMLHRHRPHLVILDLDTESAGDAAVRDQYDWEIRQQNAELLILGKAVRREETLPSGQVIAKPYHYGPLIRTIEQLLAQG